MELTGKQKRYLRSLMVTQPAVIQIGKGSVTENLIQQTNDALKARELIKIKVLNNNDEDLDELANELALGCEATVVQIIGHNFVLYRQNPEKPKIVLPE
jgi:RNA-binding protein